MTFQKTLSATVRSAGDPSATVGCTDQGAHAVTLDELRRSKALRRQCCPHSPELVAMMAYRDQLKVQVAELAEQIRRLIETVDDAPAQGDKTASDAKASEAQSLNLRPSIGVSRGSNTRADAENRHFLTLTQ